MSLLLSLLVSLLVSLLMSVFKIAIGAPMPPRKHSDLSDANIKTCATQQESFAEQ